MESVLKVVVAVAGPMTVHPLAVGVVGTVLAAAQLSGWAALGALVAPRWTQKDANATVAVYLLVGSSLTAAAAALLSMLAHVNVAAVVILGAPLVVLAIRCRQVLDLTRTLLADCRASIRDRWAIPVMSVTIAVYWLNAIVPPRDGDVMRYHLAHVRQIARDGAWIGISDFHYALPFGWTLNYLPYEMLGIPEVAHLLNLGLWLVLLAGTLSALSRWNISTTTLLFCTALAWQPLLLKVATTAFADSYSIFIVFAVALLLIRLAEGDRNALMPLGFVSYVGAQSRYQLVAVGVATAGVVALMVLRKRLPFTRLAWFGGGAAAALVLSAPFYIVNLRALDNPVWPLLIPQLNALATYGDRVSDVYQTSLTGTYSVLFVFERLRALFTDPIVFPVPLLLFGFLAVAWRHRDEAVRWLGGFLALFFLLWVAAQPLLYPRFSLFFVGALAIGVGAVLADWEVWRPIRMAARVMLIAAVVLNLGLVTLYSADGLLYIATGNLKRFHEATWFYGTYDWINRSTPPEARFLLIVSSGHSYYLDRAYRKADPFLSGEVDWEVVRSGEELDRILDKGGYRYIIYEDREWDTFLGGRQMSDAIVDAIRKGMLRQVRRFDERLVVSRIRRIAERTVVLLLERTTGSDGPSSEGVLMHSASPAVRSTLLKSEWR